MLIADKTEATTKLHYKCGNLLNKTTLQLQFFQWLNSINESDFVTATEYVIDILGLLSR